MTASMSRLGEQCLSAPINEASPGVATVQLCDQPSIAELQVSQPKADIQQCLHKLTIPATFVSVPESPSPCGQSPHASVSPPSSAFMHHLDGAPLQARNIIVFGESGVGKSSVINMIAGTHITRTSNDAVGCTFRCQCYHVPLDDLSVNLWDTVGLDEGTEGTIPARQAENSLKTFLRQITRWNGIDLLLYCVRGSRVRQALLRNYNIFYAAICRKKVPVALVVTGLENYEGDMEAWWTEHEKDLIKHGMRFDAHACVTTIDSDHPAIQDRLKHSRGVLRNLVQAKFGATSWRADEDSLISSAFPNARTLLWAAEKEAAPLIIICDATEQADQIHLFSTVAGSEESRIGDRRYKCLYVNARDVPLGDPKLCTEAAQRPDLLIFYADADSEPDRAWTAFERFHVSFGGELCPIIVVFGGLENHEAATKLWGLMSSSHSGAIIANPTYYPGPDGSKEAVERADATLAALVGEKCLMKFEEKLTRLQKLCRHSRFFFTGFRRT